MTVVILPITMAVRMKVVLISVTVVLLVTGAIIGIVFAVKGCTGIPSIKDLVITGENGKITIEWQVEDLCGGYYEVMYFIENTPIESFYMYEGSTYTFYDVAPCAFITVTIIPASKDGDRGEPLNGTIEADPGQVDNFGMKHVGANLVFSWTPPEHSKYCKYRIKFEEEVLVNNLLDVTFNYDVYLNTIPLKTCATNTYSIITVGQGVKVGTPVQLEYTVGVVTEVRDLRVMEDSEKFLVSWEIPENIELCIAQDTRTGLKIPDNIASLANYWYFTVVYREGLVIKGEMIAIDPTATFQKKTSDCSGYTMEVTANFGDSVGRARSQNRIAGLKAVTITNILEEDNNLMISWEVAETSAVCNDIEYIVAYSEGGIYQEKRTSELEYTFDLESDICTTVEISVLPIMGDFIGDETLGTIPLIKDLSITGENGEMTLVWEVQDARKHCRLEYDLMYYINGEIVQSGHISGIYYADTPTLTFLNVEPCALITVKIVPNSLEGYPEEPLIGTFESDPAAQVDDFEIKLYDANLVFSWTAPEKSMYCKYRIDFDQEEFLNDLIGETYSFNVDLSTSPLQSCSSNTYSIYTVGQGSKVGTPVKREYTTGVIKQVGNIQVIENKEQKTLRVTWEAPENTELCIEQFMGDRPDLGKGEIFGRANSLTYTVVYRDGDTEKAKDLVEDSSVTFDTFDTSDCSTYTIQITTNFGNTEGRSTIENQIAGVGAVTIANILEEYNKLKVSWEVIQNCNGMKYKVKYAEGENNQEITTSEHEYTFNVVSYICTTVKVSVIPMIEDFEGQEAIDFHVVTSGFAATALTIYQRGELLKVTWWAPTNADACTELKYKVIYSDDAGFIKEETDIIGESHDFALESSPCVRVNMSLIPFNGEVIGMETHNTDIIRIGPVGPITIIQRCDARMDVTWEAPSDILHCSDITYTVTYLEDDEKKRTTETTDLRAIFPLSRTTECIKVAVNIWPHIGRMVDGTSKMSEVFNANEGMCTPV